MNRVSTCCVMVYPSSGSVTALYRFPPKSVCRLLYPPPPNYSSVTLRNIVDTVSNEMGQGTFDL